MPESLSITITRNGASETVTLPAAEVPLFVHLCANGVAAERNPDGSPGDQDAFEAQRIAASIGRLVFNDFDAADPDAVPGYGSPRHDRYAKALALDADEVTRTAPGELRDRYLALTDAERADFRSAEQREADAQAVA